ncbi:hypothetical protein [Ornithinimicrobium cavernae]|uniref:hypothetical protein n=1 Tax=Ornithinimicrobium cavernae TaxID=2666047 RepID=UPI00192A6379|nr:hypothetical protein [Ornithinimicrobium cavernae]
MRVGATSSMVQRARDAASRGDWQTAFRFFAEADAAGQVGLDDLPVFAGVAYGSGHLDVTIELWERAHSGLTASGEEVAAAGAAVRVAMHLLFDTALLAPVRGWLARAGRLLNDDGATSAHAWYAVVRCYERMQIGDRSAADTWARRAIEVGSQCDPAAAAIGRVAEARLLILDGAVEEGLALLDEAGVAAVSRGLDPLSTGIVYCELVCALQGLAQYDLAEEWTAAMEQWSRGNAVGSLHGRCRVHRAEILRLRGRCHEAEAEALAACEELRPYVRRELGWPLTELGGIRLRMGDVAGAGEALLSAQQCGWDPQPALALMLLARGDVASASASICDALEHPTWVPSKERPPHSDLQRAPLLAAQVEIGLTAADVDRARAASEELNTIAERFHSTALSAAAEHARGRVLLADGDPVQAQHRFSEAVQLWSDVGAPYEAAVARLGLADACDASGSTHRARLERRTATEIIERIQAPGTLALGFEREGDYWTVTFEGRTVRVRDRKGMRHLSRLLARPGRSLHALDLVAAEAGNPIPGVEEAAAAHQAFGDAGEMLDAKARDAYRRRLAEIEEDLSDARARNDDGRELQADAERDFLLLELSRAVGLGGRPRRAGSATERARVAVTRAKRQAIGLIGEHHPELGQHLQRSIRTGTYCAYLPDGTRSS